MNLKYYTGVSTTYCAFIFGVYVENGCMTARSTKRLLLLRNSTFIGKYTNHVCNGIICSLPKAKMHFLFRENMRPRIRDSRAAHILGFISFSTGNG